MRKLVLFALYHISAVTIATLFFPEYSLGETLSLRWSNRSASMHEISIGLSSGMYQKVSSTALPTITIENLPSETPLFVRIRNLSSSGTIISQSHEYRIIIPDIAEVIPLDSDGDGIPDGLDNCPLTFNPSQLDSNMNGVGDVCDNGTNPVFPNPQPDPTPSPQPTPSPSPNPTPNPTPTPQNPGSNQPGTSNPPGTPFPQEPDFKYEDESERQGEILRNNFCNEWNGFFRMFNFAELRNQSGRSLAVQLAMFDKNSNHHSSREYILSPGIQIDIPLHELEGFRENEYGKVCFSYNASVGLIGGQVSYYLPAADGINFQFAYSSSFTNGRRGIVFVPTNTFNPSLNSQKENNPVANWIQITNLNNKTSSGRLFFHSQDGSLIGETSGYRVSLRAGQRQDFSGHTFMRSVGMARWIPDSPDDEFLVRVVRYIYDNPYFHNSFDTAFQINSLRGTNALLSVPIDTTQGSAIIEIKNTLHASASAEIEIRDESGTLKSRIHLGPQQLPAYGSFHLITDQLLGYGKRGTAFIKGSKRNSIAAVSMIYARDQFANLQFMYGINASPRSKRSLIGSYNTFLQKKPILAISNPGNETASAVVALKNFNSTTRTAGDIQRIPPLGTLFLDLSAYEEQNTYGQISIISNTDISAWVIREKLENFGIPSELH
jgi:hypothetical protein